MKHFPLKIWNLNFLFLLFSKITIFAKFSKNHVLSFLLMSDNLAKMVILENNKNKKFKFQIFNGKCFIFDPFPRDRKPFFKILPVFRQGSDQIYHIWKSPFGDPLSILPSIFSLVLIVLNVRD